MDDISIILEGLEPLTDPIAEHFIKGLLKQIPAWFKKKPAKAAEEAEDWLSDL